MALVYFSSNLFIWLPCGEDTITENSLIPNSKLKKTSGTYLNTDRKILSNYTKIVVN